MDMEIEMLPTSDHHFFAKIWIFLAAYIIWPQKPLHTINIC